MDGRATRWALFVVELACWFVPRCRQLYQRSAACLTRLALIEALWRSPSRRYPLGETLYDGNPFADSCKAMNGCPDRAGRHVTKFWPESWYHLRHARMQVKTFEFLTADRHLILNVNVEQSSVQSLKLKSRDTAHSTGSSVGLPHVGLIH